MSLVGLMLDFASECKVMVRVCSDDGEGGENTTWTEGESFTAAITHDQTIQGRVAESEGMTSTYTVTTDKGFQLGFHDVFQRQTDGKVFRVTSEASDKQTPDRATFQVCQVTAQEWSLT